MQLRSHPQLTGRWPPKQSVSSIFAIRGPLSMRPTLAETAVLQRVVNCPPSPPLTGAQGVILHTDGGRAVIITTDSRFREQFFHTLRQALGLSLGEIGDLDIDF